MGRALERWQPVPRHGLPDATAPPSWRQAGARGSHKLVSATSPPGRHSGPNAPRSLQASPGPTHAGSAPGPRGVRTPCFCQENVHDRTRLQTSRPVHWGLAQPGSLLSLCRPKGPERCRGHRVAAPGEAHPRPRLWPRCQAALADLISFVLRKREFRPSIRELRTHPG